MSNIKIIHSHSLGKEDAVKVFKSFEDRIKAKYGVDVNWTNSTVKIEGKGFAGTIAVKEAEVEVNVKLAFFFRPFAGKVEAAIKKELTRRLVAPVV